jgi:hypothetical protein
MPDTTTIHRQKMETLLGQMGANPELTKQFGELLESFITEQKTILESKYKTKLDAAKTLCLEETQRFKSQLAKRVQIFLEARTDKIESMMAKQVAIKESAAEADLKSIKALLEGVEINANGEADLTAIKTQLSQALKQVNLLKEERNTAVTRANRANNIAKKVLDRNRILEEAAKKVGTTTTAAPIAESVTPTIANPPKAAPKAAAPVQRTGATPKTPTTVMSEGVQAGQPQPKPTPKPTGSMVSWDPANFANNMDD